jgi:hypothetical protein
MIAEDRREVMLAVVIKVGPHDKPAGFIAGLLADAVVKQYR